MGIDTFTNPTLDTVDNTNNYGQPYINISGGTLTNADSYEVTYIRGRLTVNKTVFTVIFNKNGGNAIGPNFAQTGYDSKLSSLPNADRDYYEFKGWYTAATGGTKITTDTVFTADTEIFAQWEICKYDITVPATQVGYTMTADKDIAEHGSNVVLTFVLKAGYSKGYSFAVKVNGTPVTLDGNNNYTIENITADTVITVDGVADITAPLINGITDGTAYCTDTVFTVDEDNLDWVKVNGETVTDYTLTAVDGGKAYTVEVMDKAGNSRTVTVTVGHNFDTWDCDDYSHKLVCKNGCGKYDDESYGLHTKKYATDRVTESGITYLPYTCEVCEYNGKDRVYTLEIPYATIIEQTGNVAPGKETFKLELFGIDEDFADEPILVDCTVETNGKGSFDDVLKIELVGDDVLGFLSEGFMVRQISGSAEGWTYSDAEWFVMYRYDDGFKFAVFDITDVEGDVYEALDGLAEKDKMSFTNSYKKNAPVDNTPENPNNKPTSPQTGDNSNLWLWIALLFISGMGITAITVYGRKKRQVS